MAGEKEFWLVRRKLADEKREKREKGAWLARREFSW